MEFVDKIRFSETEWEVFYLSNMQKWILKLVINYHHVLDHLIRWKTASNMANRLPIHSSANHC